MEPSRKPVAPVRGHITIPPALLKYFTENAIIRLEPTPGLWPIPEELLWRMIENGSFQAILKDKQVAEQYEVVIVPKASIAR